MLCIRIRKVIALLLVVCSTMMLSTSAWAVEVEDEYENGEVIYIDGYGGLTYLAPNNSGEEAEPSANEVCNGLTYHKMMSSGIGYVYINGSAYIRAGAAWQCKNCKLVMVTEGDIINGSMTVIGKWAQMTTNEKISASGCIIDGPEYYGTCSKSSMDGYKFFLS